jgi:hypothetical protein
MIGGCDGRPTESSRSGPSWRTRWQSSVKRMSSLDKLIRIVNLIILSFFLQDREKGSRGDSGYENVEWVVEHNCTWYTKAPWIGRVVPGFSNA